VSPHERVAAMSELLQRHCQRCPALLGDPLYLALSVSNTVSNTDTSSAVNADGKTTLSEEAHKATNSLNTDSNAVDSSATADTPNIFSSSVLSISGSSSSMSSSNSSSMSISYSSSTSSIPGHDKSNLLPLHS